MSLLPAELMPALERIRESRAGGRMAHAYLVVGPVLGSGGDFARVLAGLVHCRADEEERPCGKCPACRGLALGTWPDAHVVEPRSKSRQIRIDDMRKLIQELSLKSYSGGWKSGTILHADRLTPNAANCFLKTLEEPAPNTLLILVSEFPQSLLPTVRSRCRRILLPRTASRPIGAWVEPLTDLLRRVGWPSSTLAAVMMADHCAGHLKAEQERIEKEVKKEAEDDDEDDVVKARASARYRQLRRTYLEYIQRWQRDVLACCSCDVDANLLYFPEEREVLKKQAEQTGLQAAVKSVAAIDRIEELLAGNLSELPSFSRAFLENT